jgi:hypothetical protein
MAANAATSYAAASPCGARSPAALTQPAGKVATASQHDAALVAAEHSRRARRSSPRRSGRSSAEPAMMALAGSLNDPSSGNLLAARTVAPMQRFPTSVVVATAASRHFDRRKSAESFAALHHWKSQGPVPASSCRSRLPTHDVAWSSDKRSIAEIASRTRGLPSSRLLLRRARIRRVSTFLCLVVPDEAADFLEPDA